MKVLNVLEEKIKEYLTSSFSRETENFLAHSIRKELLKSTKMDNECYKFDSIRYRYRAQ